ncbi:hypothetical protein HEP85_36650 [Streptomyces sp. RPA4-2]|uniref:hypothetical protein n=1 Tax=Streptomyces sp. RPA4-2 TaxID=2721244 RepID=UPI002001E1BB|nr:hypothetical protein [Streptomyces sp. RPA4-2]
MTRAPLLTLPILDGGYELTIRKLKLQDDSFTIHYSITPAVPDADSAAPPFLPFLEAKDDLGNEYLDWAAPTARALTESAPKVPSPAGPPRLQRRRSSSSASRSPRTAARRRTT